ncbi:unnamed protein product [Rhizophagus irregularis]|nr:unnamed protein product [Rhizophagus irregularis]
MMSSKFLAELSSDYEKLFETELGYDVIIYAGEESNVKEIHAHSNILCIRSQYFRSAFSNEWAEKKDGKFILRKPNISPRLFNIILRFIYCGNIELKNLQGPEVLKLLIAVDELNIQQLISYIQEYLIEHQTEFLHQNPTDGKNISTAKLSYVNNNNARYAIYCQDTQGPHMGNLYCTGTNSWIVYKHSYVNLTYPKIDIPERFMVENYEVFQVIKK